jgi:hypothetical protein
MSLSLASAGRVRGDVNVSKVSRAPAKCSLIRLMKAGDMSMLTEPTCSGLPRENGRTATKDYSVIRRTKVLRPYCCKATATSTAGPTMRQLVREMDLRPDWRISRAFQGARETSRTLPPCRTTDYTGEPGGSVLLAYRPLQAQPE